LFIVETYRAETCSFIPTVLLDEIYFCSTVSVIHEKFFVTVETFFYEPDALFSTDSPVVTLELGSNLNGSSIREGMDVYFECIILANPWVYKVIWRHNVSLH